MNIGLNPTFNSGELSIEVHFLNYNNNLYGKTLNIELLKHLRPESKNLILLIELSKIN